MVDGRLVRDVKREGKREGEGMVDGRLVLMKVYMPYTCTVARHVVGDDACEFCRFWTVSKTFFSSDLWSRPCITRPILQKPLNPSVLPIHKSWHPGRFAAMQYGGGRMGGGERVGFCLNPSRHTPCQSVECHTLEFGVWGPGYYNA